MFNNFGIWEMLIIAGAALIILGPDKFPGHAKIAIRFMRDIRTYWDDAKRDLTEELKPFKKELKELEKIKPEEFIDSLTGETESEKDNLSKYGGSYPYGDTSVPASAATSAESPGEAASEATPRSENTNWERPEGSEPYNPTTSAEPDYAPEPEKKPFIPED